MHIGFEIGQMILVAANLLAIGVAGAWVMVQLRHVEGGSAHGLRIAR